MGFSIKSRGSFDRTEAFLKKLSKLDVRSVLEAEGQKGVKALEAATPADSGLAANSWSYEVSQNGSKWTVTWHNSDIENGFPVAIMLQYGYGTGTGGYVHGRDYINPALRPIFDEISQTVWKAVTSL